MHYSPDVGFCYLTDYFQKPQSTFSAGCGVGDVAVCSLYAERGKAAGAIRESFESRPAREWRRGSDAARPIMGILLVFGWGFL